MRLRVPPLSTKMAPPWNVLGEFKVPRRVPTLFTKPFSSVMWFRFKVAPEPTSNRRIRGVADTERSGAAQDGVAVAVNGQNVARW